MTQKEKTSFDVTMATSDDAEICELIGIFMLSLIGKKWLWKCWIISYSYDGLSIVKNTSGLEIGENKHKTEMMV